MAVLQLSFRKTILNLHFIFACADSEQAVDYLNFRSQCLLTDLFTDKRSQRGITIVTDKDIQARN